MNESAFLTAMIKNSMGQIDLSKVITRTQSVAGNWYEAISIADLISL